MDLFLIGFLAALVLAMLATLWSRRKPSVRGGLPFTRRASLLTAGEMRFHKVLLRVIPPGLTVLVKVRLLDVVSVPDDAWRQYGAPASGMHLDFVLADREMKPVLVIELDDKSHREARAQARDAFKDAALTSAGLPLLRVPVVGRYDEGKLRDRVRGAVGDG